MNKKRHKGFREFPVSRILSQLERNNLLPGIVFRSARKQCDNDVEFLCSSRNGQQSESAQNDLATEVRQIIHQYGMDASIIYEHPQYEALIRAGCGAHHAGQLLVWRLLLEELMTRGKLRLLIATGTVAAGVDFPARTVVVTADSRRGDDGYEPISASEFQQMSGRAGRRGKDTVGFCLAAPGKFCDGRVVYKVSRKSAEPLRSAYFAAPSTVLNLLKYRNEDDLRHTVSLSLATFLDRREAIKIREQVVELEKELPELSPDQRKKQEKRIRREEKKAIELESRQVNELEAALSGLRALGHLNESGLTAKGVWAAELCTGLVLSLAEAIEEGIFYDVSKEVLVGLIASISGDSYRKYYSLSENPIHSELFTQLQGILDRVSEKYPASPPKEVVPDAALTALLWFDSEDWGQFSSYLKLANVAEGDIARLITQTADHLNQISRLSESHPDLARLARDTRKQLLRPPITEDYSLAAG